jgi:hypothetical protein
MSVEGGRIFMMTLLHGEELDWEKMAITESFVTPVAAIDGGWFPRSWDVILRFACQMREGRTVAGENEASEALFQRSKLGKSRVIQRYQTSRC